MALIPNTVRRNGTYQFRRRIPKHLRPRFRQRELSLSLKTRDPATARSRPRTAYLRSEELFQHVEANAAILTDDDVRALAREFYLSMLERDDQVRFSGKIFTAEEREYLTAHRLQLAQKTTEKLASNTLEIPWVTSLLERRFGSAVARSPEACRRAMHALLRTEVELSKALAARLQGDFNYVPTDKLVCRALETSGSYAGAAGANFEEAPSTRKAATPLFSAFAATFRQEQQRQNIWDGQTAAQARATYAMFAQVAGDKPLGEYDKADAVAFKRTLHDLPADYAKAKEYRGLGLAEILAQTKSNTALQRLAPGTINRHRAALAALWNAAREQGHVEGKREESPFRLWNIAKAKRPQDQRQMWSKDDLNALFQTPLWRGCQSPHRRSKPGDLIIRDEKFWLPLIAVFSGMRQEEICQLRAHDLREEEGVWVFDVNARGGNQVKNSNAVRLVPIHEQLIALGLVEVARALPAPARLFNCPASAPLRQIEGIR